MPWASRVIFESCCLEFLFDKSSIKKTIVPGFFLKQTKNHEHGFPGNQYIMIKHKHCFFPKKTARTKNVTNTPPPPVNVRDPATQSMEAFWKKWIFPSHQVSPLCTGYMVATSQLFFFGTDKRRWRIFLFNTFSGWFHQFFLMNFYPEIVFMTGMEKLPSYAVCNKR